MKPNTRLTAQGFTLLELMVAVIILGILGSLALPTYQRSVERRYWRQAQDLLHAIYAGERAYYFATGSYHDPGPCDETLCDQVEWQKICTEPPFSGSVPLAFEVDTTTPCGVPACFTAKATHTSGLGESMTIDQENMLCADPAIPPNFCGSWPQP